MRLWPLLALALLWPTAPRAEDLVLSLSSHRVVIASNFTGTDVVLFGAVRRTGASVARRGGYDIVVTVRGPTGEIVVRRKERTFGVWVNRDSVTYPLAPAYLAVITSKKPDEITTAALQQRFGVGLLAALPTPAPLVEGAVPTSTEVSEFRDALLRLQRGRGLYREIVGGVTFLDETLFRAAIPIPANVPIGAFEVEVKVFADGALLVRDTTALEVTKSGFEAQVAQLAETQSLLYGVGAGLLALLFGWGASILFRRD